MGGKSVLRATVTLNACAIGAALAAEPARSQAPIVTDGTMGARVELNGPAMQIPHTLGTQAGTNLFHSFQRFNIPARNSATFTGPSGIDNVVSRVTGGEASTIDGAFRSTIPGANVWFTNPAGVTFGPTASLHVPASFHASTADEIRFPDGGRFSADLGATSTLSVAPPEAFGFLSSNPAPLKVERSQLSVATDATLSLAAGEIDIQGNAPIPDSNRPELVNISGGTLRARSGTINLASVAGAAEVKTDGTVSGNNHGAIRLTNGALVNASGDGAGVVRIRGGELTATGSYIIASNTGSVTGAGGIDISADRLSLQDDGRSSSYVIANARNAGDAAPISVRAPDITMRNSDIQSIAYAGGKAGNIRIDAPNQMILDNVGSVLASSLSLDPAGAAGGITVKAGNLVIRDQSQIVGLTRGPAPAGNINVTVDPGTLIIESGSAISSGTFGAGKAGNILIDAPNQMILDNNGSVLASSLSLDPAGAAGDITVRAGNLVIRDQSQIVGLTRGPAPAGNINVTVHPGTLIVESGSEISSGTFGAGKAGNILIDAPNQMILDNDGSILASSVSPDPAGAAGDITVKAGNLVIRDQSQITSLTRGLAPAGKITVTAEMLLVEDSAVVAGEQPRFATGIISSAESGSSGNAGTVIIEANNLALGPETSIDTSTDGSGNAGTVIIEANNLALGPDARINSRSSGAGAAGEIILTGVSKLFMSGAKVTTESGSAGGGNIEISGAGKIILRDGSRIGVDVIEGEARAGDITIGSRFLVLDRSAISATADAGSGGNIRIASDFIVSSPDSVITARAGPAGVAGTVVLTSPETDVTVDVTQLPGEVMNTAGQMQERCAVRGGVEGSSFTIAGLEALSPTLEGYLPGTYAGVADETAAVTDGSLMVASGGGLAFPVWTVACGDAR